MPIVALLSALLKLAGIVAGIAANRQLLEAGKAEAIVAYCNSTSEDIRKARRAADAVEHPQSQSDDSYAKRVHDKYQRPDE